MPNRLLDPEPVSRSAQLKIHIVNPADPAQPYMTLSQVWGSVKHKTLTTVNLDAMQAEIPDERLPKTFKDAIDIAGLLGCNYIWIDTLCILQDSTKD